MANIIVDLPSTLTCLSTCTYTNLPTPIDSCLGEFIPVAPEVIVLWFDCNFVPTNDWATAADIVTDIVAGNVIGNVLRWDGKEKREFNTIERAAGLNPINGTWSLSLEFYEDKRQIDNSEYAYYEQLIQKANTGSLHMAYVTSADNLTFLRTPISLAESDDIQPLEGIESINLSAVASGSGVGLITPIQIAGSYTALLAAI